MIKVLFVCHGNICRSTMAESVMTYLVEKEGLADKFYINSAATSREEIGNGVHHGTVAKLKKEGIPVIPHSAVQMTLNDYEEYDYLIGMDTENIRNMQRISGGDPDEKIYKLLTFAGSGLDVADPWYTGDFEATYRDVQSPIPGYELGLERNGNSVCVDMWELCYQVCFRDYSPTHAAQESQEIEIDTSLIDETGDVDWQSLDTKAQRLVQQVFDTLPTA